VFCHHHEEDAYIFWLLLSDYCRLSPRLKVPSGAMTEYDKQWNMQYEQLVEFKRNNGHCLVPKSYEQDQSLGRWVGNQRNYHKNDKLRFDRKIILDEIGFVWKADGPRNINDDIDKIWNQQYAKLAEFKRKNGHCMVPQKNKADKSLGQWVLTQRKCRINNKIRPHRKELLDEIGFAWKATCTLVARCSTKDVRGLVIGSFHDLVRSPFSLT
jgi:uncharacterized protein YbgA (DUF1722 family)